jgi:hypothetical protein
MTHLKQATLARVAMSAYPVLPPAGYQETIRLVLIRDRPLVLSAERMNAALTKRI